MSLREQHSTEFIDDTNQTKRLDQHILSFIKDWGGVATVIIAILYTFPFDIFDRIVHRKEANLASARHALADTFSLRADKISALQKANEQSPNYQAYIDAVNGAFDIRTYNLMV